VSDRDRSGCAIVRAYHCGGWWMRATPRQQTFTGRVIFFRYCATPDRDRHHRRGAGRVGMADAATRDGVDSVTPGDAGTIAGNRRAASFLPSQELQIRIHCGLIAVCGVFQTGSRGSGCDRTFDPTKIHCDLRRVIEIPGSDAVRGSCGFEIREEFPSKVRLGHGLYGASITIPRARVGGTAHPVGASGRWANKPGPLRSEVDVLLGVHHGSSLDSGTETVFRFLYLSFGYFALCTTKNSWTMCSAVACTPIFSEDSGRCVLIVGPRQRGTIMRRAFLITGRARGPEQDAMLPDSFFDRCGEVKTCGELQPFTWKN
jgi:hypothetical protein